MLQPMLQLELLKYFCLGMSVQESKEGYSRGSVPKSALKPILEVFMSRIRGWVTGLPEPGPFPGSLLTGICDFQDSRAAVPCVQQ